MKNKTMFWPILFVVAGWGCGDDTEPESPETNNVVTNNATTNNANPNNSSANEKFRFTFANESGEQMLEDFSGASAIGVNSENPNFSINLGNNSGASIALTVVKEQGPLMATTYQTDLFQYAFGDGTCIRSNSKQQEVRLTFTELDPVTAEVAGEITCGAGTPEEFTAEISGNFEL